MNRAVSVRSASTDWLDLVRQASIAAALATFAVVMGWRGADWPAQVYRAELFDRVGFTLWDNQWYSGHQIPAYSVLFPPLGALVGVVAVAAISSVAASVMFASIARRWFPAESAHLAIMWFSVGTMCNLVIGRVTFALGLAIGLGAITTMLARSRWAVLVAIATPLASPVAGIFVVVIAIAWWLGGRGNIETRRLGPVVAVASVAPIAVLGVWFPSGGTFPFRFGDLASLLGCSAVIVTIAPRRWCSVRIGAVMYGAIAILVFLVPNPLGGNLVRLGMFTAGPLLAAILWPQRRWLLVVLGLPVIVWQWRPAVDAITIAGRDPSTDEAYYAPLLDYLADTPFVRIEIPFTKRHWESAYVAPRVALARGWERQVDIDVNSIFYESDLDAATYTRWLSDNAVKFVALPDTDLDYSARAEAELLRSGVPGLRPAWGDAHWTVWEVVDTEPLVDGPAELVEMESDRYTLDVAEAGDITVRIRFSPHWTIDGNGCVSSSPDGWTIVTAEAPGRLVVRQSISSPTPPLGRSDKTPPVQSCP